MPSITVTVSTDLDDAFQQENTGDTVADGNNPGNVLGVGTDFALRQFTGAAASSRYWVGCRFLNVTVPKFANITAATFSGYAFNSNKLDDPDCQVYGNAIDNATGHTHGVGTFSVSGKALTTANTTWLLTDTGSPKWEISPDISAVVQEIVNRAGWVSGNAMGIILKPGTSGNSLVIAGAGSGASGNTFWPKLDITYQVPAADMSGAGDLTATATATTSGLVSLTGLGDLSAFATTPLCQFAYIAYDYGGAFFCLDNLGNFVTPITSHVQDICIVDC